MVSAIGNAAAPAVQAKSGFSGPGTGADFETFLRMLTAQLRNQDPLNPMQSTDFAVQLATFAGVEQQAMTNKLLTQMAGQSGAGLAGAASFIGKEARTTAPVWFGNVPLTLDIAPDRMADSVQLIAHDARGREVGREEIGPGTGQIEWYGRDAFDEKLPDGQYSFTIESYSNGTRVATSKVGVYARIVEAELADDGMVLIFQGGGAAPAREITAIRDPR
jgi:flagellar basal-body rod modification protein FlgD